MSLRITRRRAAALSALAALAVAGSAVAGLAPLPGPLGLVNDDPAAGIDPRLGVNASDVVGGSLTAGGAHVPWAVFEQQTEGPTRVFSRSFANGVWTTRGPALNVNPAQDAEAPSIDFAGPDRTVPWAAWYEETPAFGATQIFASRFDPAGNRWVAAGQDRRPGELLPSLNINPDFDAENPAVAGGSTTPGGTPSPWVAWEELDGPTVTPGTQRRQIFVSRAVRAGTGQTDCTGFSPGDGPVVGGFCWQETGIARVSRTSLKSDNATDPSLNVDTTRDGIEPDIAFTGPGDTVPWVVWYETGPSGRGLSAKQMVFAAKGVPDPAAEGGFRWTAVGRNLAGVLDASEAGGVCAAGIAAEFSCSLNTDPGTDAFDPRIAAGTMTPGAPTVPWVVWTEGPPAFQNLFAARLVAGERFELVNGGRPLTTGISGSADITFTGNTPVVTWIQRLGGVRTGHFEGPAANPVFVEDDALDVRASSAPRISSGCTATPATADGATCPGGRVGSPFLLVTRLGQGNASPALVAHGSTPEEARTLDATAITATSATLNGEAVTGGGPVRVRFDFGPTTAYGSTTPAQRVAPTGTVAPFSISATGLAPAAEIHYRAVVEGDFGTVTGADRVIRTGAAPAPPQTGATARIRLTSTARVVRRNGRITLRVKISVNRAATVRLQVRRIGRPVLRRTVVRPRAGTFTLTARLPRGGRGRAVVKVIATSPRFGTAVVARNVRVPLR